ncbi:MAG: SpoIID/LytB domain-containing protein [Fibrobacter sp.]|nr:SpoIID/LytB domain-containing protein [Fibrobacter sp.]
MINRTLCSFFSVVAFCCIFFYCSYPKFIVPDPPQASVKTVQKQEQKPDLEVSGKIAVDSVSEINFADAFLNDSDTAVVSENENETLQSFIYPLFFISNNRVRVALLRNITQITFYSVSKLSISNLKNYSFQGRIVFRIRGQQVWVTSENKNHIITLPCTLKSKSEYNYIDIGDKSYRGDIILTMEKNGRFSVINSLPVEEYLRGVVPLEIGRRPESEALKAQAVAARTYTYKRIEERKNHSFDLTCTVTDQVYGGVHVEYRESDSAIKATENLVMVYEDSLVHAYYHSTCGGKTANIEDVWDKPSYNYLRSVRDTDSTGNAYCRISRYFTWKEKWPKRDFNTIVSRYLKNQFPQNNIGGKITVFKIESQFTDGRINVCTFGGPGWTQKTGGDKIRFILRRNTSDNAILRSANFKITALKDIISVEGRGYGHGVGMCQMGAIGRARAGQKFDQILKSYYTGISIHKATITKRKR